MFTEHRFLIQSINRYHAFLKVMCCGNLQFSINTQMSIFRHNIITKILF